MSTREDIQWWSKLYYIYIFPVKNVLIVTLFTIFMILTNISEHKLTVLAFKASDFILENTLWGVAYPELQRDETLSTSGIFPSKKINKSTIFL